MSRNATCPRCGGRNTHWFQKERVFRCLSSECEHEFREAVDDPSKEYPVDIRELPSFVASPLQAYFQEPHPELKLWRICDATELTVRYCSAILLAHLRDQENGRLPRELADEIGPLLLFPSLSKWRRISEAAVSGLRSPDLETGVLSGVSRLLKECLWPLIGSQGQKEEESVLPLRNYLAHAGPLHRDGAENLLQSHESRFMDSASVIADFTAEHELWLTDGSDEGLALKGGGPIRAPATLRKPNVVLRANGSALDLAPFCGVARTDQAAEVLPKVYVRSDRRLVVYNVLLGSPPVQSEGGWELDALSALLASRSLPRTRGASTWAQLREDAERAVVSKDLVEELANRLRDSAGETFWLWGPRGSGKSAFSAAVCESNKLSSNPNHVLRIPHRFHRRDRTGDRFSFMQSCIDELTGWAPLRNELPDLCRAAEEKRDEPSIGLVHSLLDGAARLGEGTRRAPKVIFFLDGVDELADAEPEVLRDLAGLARRNVSVLLIGRRKEGTMNVLGNDAIREAIPPAEGHPDGGMRPLELDQIREILLNELDARRYDVLRDEGGSGRHSEYIEEIARRASGWPLYVVRVASALVEGRICMEDGVNALPETVEDDWRQALKEIGASDRNQARAHVLATLQVAEEALGAEELCELLSYRNVVQEGDAGRRVIQDAIERSGGLIKAQSTEAGLRYTLYHESLRELLDSTDGPLRGSVDLARRAVPQALRATLDGELPECRGFLLRRGVRLVAEEQGAEGVRELLNCLALPLAAAELQDPRTWATVTDEIAALGTSEALSDYAELPAFMRRNQHMIMRGGAAALLSVATAHGRSTAISREALRAHNRNRGQVVPWLRRLNPPQEPTQSIIIRSFCGHYAPIGHADGFDEGKQVFTLTLDGVFRVWDNETGVKLRESRLGGPESLTAALVPGTSTAFVPRENATVRLVDLERSEVVYELDHEATWVSMDGSGNRLATSSNDEIVIWDLQKRAPFCTYELPGTFHLIALSPIGDAIACAFAPRDDEDSTQSTLVVWKVGSGETALPATALNCQPRALSWLGGGLLAISYPDHQFEVWDIYVGIRVFSVDLESPVGEARLGPHDDLLVTTRSGRLVRLNLEGDQVGAAFVEEGIVEISRARGDEWLVSGWGDCAHLVRSPNVGEVASIQDPLLCMGENGEGSLMWATARGRMLVVAGDATDVTEVGVVALPFSRARVADLFAGAVAFGSDEGRVLVYEIESGAQLSDFETEHDGLDGIWFCSDGHHIVCQVEDATLEIWAYRERRLIEVIHEACIRHFDERRAMAALGQFPVRVVGFNEGAPRSVMHLAEDPDRLVEVVVSARAGLAAEAVEKDETARIDVWDTRTKSHMRALPIAGSDDRPGGRRHVNASLVFSADGKRLAFSNGWPDIDLFTISGGGALLREHAGNVKRMAFSPTGKLLVSCSEDAEIIVWDAESAQLLARAPATGSVSRLHVSDAGRIAAGLESGAIELFSLEGMAENE